MTPSSTPHALPTPARPIRISVVVPVFDEVTAEVPVIKPAATHDPFRIGGDELR